MNRMPCRVSDDPSYDYSDYIEEDGYYKLPVKTNHEGLIDILELPTGPLTQTQVGDENEDHKTD